MKVLAKLVFGTLGCVLLISGIAVISPRAVHAVVATIIRDQDNPARHPFTTTCTGASITQVSTCNPPAIPAGQEVVIETISFTGFGDSDKSVLVPTISTIAAGFFQTYFLTPISDTGAFQPTNADFSGVQSARLYADPGTLIECGGFTRGQNPSVGLTIECKISGYFVTLP